MNLQGTPFASNHVLRVDPARLAPSPAWSTAVTVLLVVAAVVVAFWAVVGIAAYLHSRREGITPIEDLPGPAPVPRRPDEEPEEIDETDERFTTPRTRLDALKRSSSGLVRITAIDFMQRSRRLASRRDIPDAHLSAIRAVFRSFEIHADAYLRDRSEADSETASLLDGDIIESMRGSGARLDAIGREVEALVPKLAGPA